MKTVLQNLATLVLILCMIPLHGQTETKVERIQPRIWVENLMKDEIEIEISEVKTDVKVIGPMVVTTVEIVLYNPNQRILEGQIQFPLADGQSVSGFALDINGKLRDGVVVEKATGQKVFESIVRQGVDPGLLEKTQGNNFKTRIYPLPIKGYRRISITYEQILGQDNGFYRFTLPVDYQKTVKRFNLQISVFGAQSAPSIHHTNWGNFSFDKQGDAYIASHTFTDFNANGQLEFLIPIKDNRQVFIENGKISGQSVFFSQLFPKIESQIKKKSSHIAIFWDRSLSMDKRNVNKDLQLISSYIKQLKNVTVDLYTFNIALNNSTHKIVDGNWDNLKNKLINTVNDGATQLGILDFTKIQADEILLFSDALSNFGKSIPQIGKTPVYTISSSLSADHSLLKYISNNTGGQYINLSQITSEEALEALNQETFRFISAEYNRAEIDNLVTSNQSINNISGLSVAGKLKTDKAIITMNFGSKNQIKQTISIELDRSKSRDYDNLVERIWAETKISTLDQLYEQYKNDIEVLGRQYNIVTRGTSLIVLENLEDYIQYKITPPSELQDQYNSLLKQIGQEKKHQIDSHYKRVITYIDERKKWWNTDFPEQFFNHKKSKILEPSSEPPIRTQLQDDETSPIAESSTNGRMMNSFESERSMFSQNRSEKKEMISNISVKPTIERRAKVKLQGWNPETPYLTELKQYDNPNLYTVYLKLREKYKSTPSFYLDVSNLLDERGLKKEALLALSNLAEFDIENYRLLRVLGHRLNQLNYTAYAINQFEKVLKLRPEEPQSYRDLASVYTANKEYQKAVDLLHNIVEHSWDNRFPEIELIAAEEMNNIILKAQHEGIKIDKRNIDSKLLFEMPLNIRIVLNWDTDNSDMDLWVVDPHGEKCYYGYRETKMGGLISRDFTGGYGPEEFVIKNAVKGKYLIKANYYGSREQTIVGPTTIYLDIYTNYGTSIEKKETITLRLTQKKEVIDIGEIIF